MNQFLRRAVNQRTTMDAAVPQPMVLVPVGAR